MSSNHRLGRGGFPRNLVMTTRTTDRLGKRQNISLDNSLIIAVVQQNGRIVSSKIKYLSIPDCQYPHLLSMFTSCKLVDLVGASPLR